MKITDILIENKQLDEGPLLNKVGDVVGKGVGSVGKSIGAVAGGVAGLGTAIKKGYRAGKTTVAGAGDDEEQTTGTTPAPAAGAAPPAQTAKTSGSTTAPKKAAAPEKTATPVKPKGNSATMQGVKSGLNKALGARAFDIGDNNILPTPNSGDYGQLSKDKNKIWNKKSQAWEPYDQSTGAAPTAGASAANAPGAANTPAADQAAADTPPGAGQAAAATPAAAAPAASQTVYAQVKASVDKLDKKGKQRILQLLQKSLGAPAAPAAAAAPAAPKLGVAPTMSTVTKNWDAETGEPLTPKAKAEYAKFSPEQKAEIEKNKAARKPARATQAEIDADRERIMGPTSDSIIRTAKPISESFSLYRKH